MVLEAQVVRYQDLPNTVDGLCAWPFCREARPNRYADTGYWFVLREGVLTFNKGTKHKGEPLAVAHTDPGFLKWMLDSKTCPKIPSESCGVCLEWNDSCWGSGALPRNQATGEVLSARWPNKKKNGASRWRCNEQRRFFLE